MKRNSGLTLLNGLCACPELVPDFWGLSEPIDIPFDPENVEGVISSMAPNFDSHRSLIFFEKRESPGFLLSFDLRLGPIQWTTAHNSLAFKVNDQWPGGDKFLARYLPNSLLPNYPDYASVPEWSLDKERYAVLRRTHTPQSLISSFSKTRPITAPFGPYGCLGDVQWFNFYGQVYVDAIGKDRLMNAGWHRVDEIGGGLACYATANLDDPDSRQRRDFISQAIAEFVWDPDCKPEQKRIPVFDFSEQSAAQTAFRGWPGSA